MNITDKLKQCMDENDIDLYGIADVELMNVTYSSYKEGGEMRLDQYFGKKLEITDIDDILWIGKAVSYESPEDSEDGYWWIDIIVENKKDFGELTISEEEIKSINVQ